MANGGWCHADEEWNRMEEQLRLLDPDIERFAHKYHAIVVKKAKDWPGRSIEWGGDVQSFLDITVVNSATLTLNLSVCVFQDRDGKRFWKQDLLRTGVQASEVVKDFLGILETGKRAIDHWSMYPEKLEFATNLELR